MVPENPRTSGAKLRSLRCVRHPAREAAARCPSCGSFYCRECIVEHQGKVLCASCLARIAAVPVKQRSRLVPLRRISALLLAGMVAWTSFYFLGWLLLRIPPSFHDGTVWNFETETE